MKTYDGRHDELNDRITALLGTEATDARGLEIRVAGGIDLTNVSEDDTAIYPFSYKMDGNKYRGAFTNGDPVWEIDDPDAFAVMMGE